MITDQHILAPRTESQPFDELNKRLCFLILLLQQAQIPQEQTEELKNEVLIEPSLNQEGSPSPRKMGQLSTQEMWAVLLMLLRVPLFFWLSTKKKSHTHNTSGHLS